MNPQTNNDRAVIQLETPIVRGQTEITEVEVRRPLGGELRGISLVDVVRMDVNALLTLLPRVTEPPLLAHELNRLDAADLVQFGMYLSGHFVPARLQDEAANQDAA